MRDMTLLFTMNKRIFFAWRGPLESTARRRPGSGVIGVHNVATRADAAANDSRPPEVVLRLMLFALKPGAPGIASNQVPISLHGFALKMAVAPLIRDLHF